MINFVLLDFLIGFIYEVKNTIKTVSFVCFYMVFYIKDVLEGGSLSIELVKYIIFFVNGISPW